MDGDSAGATGPSAECRIVTSVTKLAGLFRTRLASSLVECGLNDARFSVLQALSTAGTAGCPQKELARTLQYSESNVSSLLDRMSADGLVRRRRSETDRRKVLIQISEMGERLLARGNLVFQNVAAELLQRVPEPQSYGLAAQLDQLRQQLDSEAASNVHEKHSRIYRRDRPAGHLIDPQSRYASSSAHHEI